MSAAMMHGGGMMGGGAVVLLLVVLLSVVTGAALMWIAQARRTVDGGGDANGSRAELDRRYAAGELSREEYLQRRRDIESSS